MGTQKWTDRGWRDSRDSTRTCFDGHSRRLYEVDEVEGPGRERLDWHAAVERPGLERTMRFYWDLFRLALRRGRTEAGFNHAILLGPGKFGTQQ